MSINKRYNNYKFRAKKKNIEFELSVEQFDFLTNRKCFYCKTLPEKGYVGIDRANNNIGYVSFNCVPCCWDCNRAKSNMSRKDFYKFRERFNLKKTKYIDNPNKKSFRRKIAVDI